MNWNLDRPINELPNPLRKLFLKEAHLLYQEMQSQKLEVCLIPAPNPHHEGHKIRIATNHNPEWYKEIYWSMSNFRRDLSMRALERIINTKDKAFVVKPYKYDAIYREIIEKRLKEFFSCPTYDNPYHKKMQKFLSQDK